MQIGNCKLQIEWRFYQSRPAEWLLRFQFAICNYQFAMSFYSEPSQ